MSEIELPAGWEWKKLGEVSNKINYGYTASSTLEDTGIKFLRITDIQDYKVLWETVPFCPIDESTVEKYLIKEGDLLFARTGATVGKSFLIKGSFPKSVFASYLIRVSPQNCLESSFIAYFFQSPDYWIQIKNSSVGIGQPNVNGTTLAKLLVPIPPLSVQQQIVAAIEELFSELDAGVQELQTALARLKTYRQAVLHHYLNNPDWERVKLGDIISIGPQNGLYKSQTLYGTGNRIVRIDNFYDGILNPEVSFRRVQIDPNEVSLYKLNEGDILVNRVNSMSHIGKCAFVKELSEETVFESNIMRFDLDKQKAYALFVVHFLTSPSGLSELRKNAKQAVNQASINQQDVKGVEMYLPDLPTQNQIVAEIEERLSEADAMEATIRNELKRAENLRQSILKQAFAGKLVAAGFNESLVVPNALSGTAPQTSTSVNQASGQLNLF